LSTYRELRNDIISDMARESEEGITAAADTAIAVAIRHYESHPFWFLETQGTIIASPGDEYTDLPSDCGSTELTVTLTDNGDTYRLEKRQYQTLEEWSNGSSLTGAPTDYATYQQQVRWYPIPDATYTATVSYTRKLGAPAEGSENVWTQDAQMLIRGRTEWQMHSLRYHDAEAAAIAKQVEEDALRGLLRQHTLRTSTGYTRKRRI
jgi:hypothetical protein